MPDRHGGVQAGGAANAVAAVRLAQRRVEEAPLARAGEGAGVSGRAAHGSDIQRGGAWEPSVPKDAEDGVPGADEASDRGPTGVGPSTGTSGRRPHGYHTDPPQGAGGMKLSARFRRYSVCSLGWLGRASHATG